MYKISVIVPVYQAEKYIKRCVDSILGQTYKNLEIILVNDGSKDKSGSICDDYAETDVRIKVVHQKNAGVSAARNMGLKIAGGEYITFVDSDDFIESNMYEEMMKKVQMYNCDVVMCDCIKDSGTIKVPYTHGIRAGFYDYEQLKKEYYPHLLMMENVEYPATISNWLMMFKKELVENIRYVENVRFSEDLLFGAQVMYQATSFYYMKGDNYYHYWLNLNSATHVYAADKWVNYQNLYKNAKDWFGKKMEYDFTHQLDLLLLFLIYNAVGEILGITEFTKKERIVKVKKILNCKIVKELFKTLQIGALPIPLKLKCLTLLYKYRVGLGILCR